MIDKLSMKNVIYNCIQKILVRDKKEYASLNEIYIEVANYLETEVTEHLKSQIRGRLQENCMQYPNSFLGDNMFYTEKLRSGKWAIITHSNSPKKYIRFEKNTYLITEDDWQTIKSVEHISESYNRETNLDKAYKAKLMILLGNNEAEIIIQELNKIRSLLKELKQINKINDGYGTAFEVFAISTIYNNDYEETIKKYIVHGDHDGKIDAIYFGDNKNVDIYQIKIGNMDNDDYQRMQMNYNDCLNGDIPENGEDLYKFISSNISFLEKKKLQIKSISTNSSRDTNYKPLAIYQLFFQNKLLPISDNNITLRIQKPTLKINNDYQYNISCDEHGNYIFYMSAKNLINYLIKSLGLNPENYNKETIDISKYFSDNVRGVLTVNKKMIRTIHYEPENFLKYNNGISITGEVEDLVNAITIKNPMINNGQQTITTLLREGVNLDKIVLSIKITNEKNPMIKGKISQYSNEQVKVKAIDMLSLNPFIRNIQKQIFERKDELEKYFLNIYSSGKRSYHNILSKLYKSNNIIDLLDFIKLYFSLENKKELGNWKNSPSSQIEKIVIDNPFNVEQSLKVCKAITDFENFLDTIENKKEKDDYKSSDLAFKYLLCHENLKVEEAATIINMVNQEYFYKKVEEKSKLIDIYKSSTIINKLETQLEIYHQNKRSKEKIGAN